MDRPRGRDFPVPRVSLRWSHPLHNDHRDTLRCAGHQIISSGTSSIRQRDHSHQVESRLLVRYHEHSLDTLRRDLHRCHTSDIRDSVRNHDHWDSIREATHEVGNAFADSIWAFVSVGIKQK